MFAGHIGVALVVGSAERRVNVGVFVAAALLLDLLLWSLILLGWESVNIPSDFAATHQADFVFPYSHSLLASVAWSIVAGAIAGQLRAPTPAARWRIAALVAATVYSHWLLDALVHRPELPLAGGTSAKVGLGLWNTMPFALAVEASLALIGLFVFLRKSALARSRSVALGVLSVVILGFTVVGMTVAPPPPSALAMAGSSLVTLVLVCVLFGWLGRSAREGQV